MEKLKILVVDDESRMRKLVKDFLVKAGYDVIEAGDGEQAVDTFYAQKDIALIILDVMMPKMDGWQVCREIRQNSKVPIIMLTAKSEERDELLGFDLGVDEYISKPFSPKILVARVEAILRRSGGNGRENFPLTVIAALRRVAPHLGVRQDIQRQNLQRQPQAAAQLRRVPPLKGWLKLGLGKIGLHLRACRLGAVEQIRRIHSTGQGQRALWVCVKIFLQCHHKPHLSASVTLILS